VEVLRGSLDGLVEVQPSQGPDGWEGGFSVKERCMGASHPTQLREMRGICRPGDHCVWEALVQESVDGNKEIKGMGGSLPIQLREMRGICRPAGLHIPLISLN
jgi:hypothetical protein